MKYLSNLIEPATFEVASLADYKRYIRQSHSIDDSILGGILQAAVAEVETYVQRAFGRQLRGVTLAGAPVNMMELDIGPIIGVPVVRYYDQDNVLQTMPNTDYAVEGMFVVPASGWPSTKVGRTNGFQLQYYAGIVDDSVSPPAGVLDSRYKMAALMLAQVSYDRSTQNAELLKQRAYEMVDTLRNGQGI